MKRLGTALHVVQNKLTRVKIVGSETAIPRGNSWGGSEKDQGRKVFDIFGQSIVHI